MDLKSQSNSTIIAVTAIVAIIIIVINASPPSSIREAGGFVDTSIYSNSPSTGGAVSSSGNYIQKTIGEQKVAVFLIDDIHDGQAQSIDSIRNVLIGDEYSLNEYLKEVSYGKTWIKPDIFGWYDIRTLGLGECVMPTFEQALSLASGDQRDLRQYDRVLLMYRSKANCLGGGQNYGERTISTSDGIIKIGVVLLAVQERDYVADTRIESSIPHEFVHNMGIRAHANAYNCGTKILSSNSSECTQVHYGDTFDILGRTITVHPNVCFKRALGWIDSSNFGLRQITSSGTYAVYPQEILTSPGAKGLEIKLATPIQLNQVGRFDADAMDSLFIETRTKAGKFTDFQTYDSYLNGIFIRGGQYGLYGDRLNTANQYDMQCAPTFLLDSTPGSADQFQDAAFGIDKSFYEPVNGIHITPKTIRSDGGIDIEILFDTTDTIKPSVSLISPKNKAIVRKAHNIVLSASATDNVGVTNVRFVVNGANVCQDSTATNGIYSCSWLVPNKARVKYLIYAQAYDAKNNVGVSNSVSVTSK